MDTEKASRKIFVRDDYCRAFMTVAANRHGKHGHKIIVMW